MDRHSSREQWSQAESTAVIPATLPTGTSARMAAHNLHQERPPKSCQQTSRQIPARPVPARRKLCTPYQRSGHCIPVKGPGGRAAAQMSQPQNRPNETQRNTPACFFFNGTCRAMSTWHSACYREVHRTWPTTPREHPIVSIPSLPNDGRDSPETVHQHSQQQSPVRGACGLSRWTER